jgi:predicted metal-binding membrane protein
MDVRSPPVGFLFAMWWIMMVAMMLPSAAPMILLFDTVSKRQHVPTAIFGGTYLAVWGLFSIAAALLQSRIEEQPPYWLGAAILIGAGLYQLTPLKQLCLRQCQSPLQFVMTRWRPGLRGAVVMGVQHGLYCLGCCWVLMLLLFVGGVMNLYWIIGLALYVLAEKYFPAGGWLSRGAGVALLAAGVLAAL